MALSYIFVASSLEKQWGGGYFLLYGSCISGIKEKPALKIKRSAEVGCAEVKAVTSRGSQHFSPLVLFFLFFSLTLATDLLSTAETWTVSWQNAGERIKF